MQKRVLAMKLDEHVYPRRKAVANGWWLRAMNSEHPRDDLETWVCID
jgi:hypothetical protein